MNTPKTQSNDVNVLNPQQNLAESFASQYYFKIEEVFDNRGDILISINFYLPNIEQPDNHKTYLGVFITANTSGAFGEDNKNKALYNPLVEIAQQKCSNHEAISMMQDGHHDIRISQNKNPYLKIHRKKTTEMSFTQFMRHIDKTIIQKYIGAYTNSNFEISTHNYLDEYKEKLRNLFACVDSNEFSINGMSKHNASKIQNLMLQHEKNNNKNHLTSLLPEKKSPKAKLKL